MNIFLKNIQFALLSLEQPRTLVSQWILEAKRSQFSGFWPFCAPKMATMSQKCQIVGPPKKVENCQNAYGARSILGKNKVHLEGSFPLN